MNFRNTQHLRDPGEKRVRKSTKQSQSLTDVSTSSNGCIPKLLIKKIVFDGKFLSIYESESCRCKLQ